MMTSREMHDNTDDELEGHPLEEYHLRLDEGRWTVLHTGAILSYADEERFLNEQPGRPPYGVALWPSAIAMAHELASRSESLRGSRILELGAGTGLPGIVAASLGARVVQTDRNQLALTLCERNGARNRVTGVEHRLADWTAWTDDTRYDLIIGADILYAARLHPFLVEIFQRNLAPSGRVLIADPFRAASLTVLQSLESDGWSVTLAKWRVGEQASPRPIGVYELSPPAR